MIKSRRTSICFAVAVSIVAAIGLIVLMPESNRSKDLLLHLTNEFVLSLSPGDRDFTVRAAGVKASPVDDLVIVGTYDANTIIADVSSKKSYTTGMKFAGNAVAWSPDGKMVIGKSAEQYGDVGPFVLYPVDTKTVVGATDPLLADDVAWVSSELFVIGSYFRPDMAVNRHQPISVFRVTRAVGNDTYRISREAEIEIGSYCDQVESIRVVDETLIIGNSSPPTAWLAKELEDGKIAWNVAVKLPEQWTFGTLAASRKSPRAVVAWSKSSGADVPGEKLGIRKNYLSAFEIIFDAKVEHYSARTLWEKELPPDPQRNSALKLGDIAVTGDGAYVIAVSNGGNLVLDMNTGESCGSLHGRFVGVDILHDDSGVALVRNDGRLSIIQWR